MYVVEIRAFADFDGVLAESSWDFDRELKDLLEEIEQSDPEELEKEVYQEYTLLLCRSCRDRFVEETRPFREGLFQAREDPDRFIH